MKSQAAMLLAGAVGVGGFVAGYFLAGPGSPTGQAGSARYLSSAELAALNPTGTAGEVAPSAPGAFATIAANDKEARLFAALRDPNDLRRNAGLYAAAHDITMEEL